MGCAVSSVEVRLARDDRDRSYRVHVEAGPDGPSRLVAALRALRPEAARVALVTDDRVGPLHGPPLRAALAAAGLAVAEAVVPEGERHKTLEQAAEIARCWLRGGVDRSSIALCLGGGVIGDLGGFAAAIYMRGLEVVQAPTTLIAQLDAAIGGKNGVDLDDGKNLLGTFWQPLFVFSDVATLRTLDRRDLIAGCAEAVKHALIADPGYLDLIVGHAAAIVAADPAALEPMVLRSCEIKARIVEGDERETSPVGQGGRALLNLGHTVGHAIESASFAGPAPLRHGEAVALGLVATCRVGRALGITSEAVEARVLEALEALGLPTDLDGRLAPETLGLIGKDKKRTGKQVRFVVIEDVGRCRTVALPIEKIGEILLRG